MKKRYTGLVSALQLLAILIGGLGVIGGLLSGSSVYGSFANAVVIIISSLVTGVLLGAAAAVVDLLAGIEINSFETNYHTKLLIKQRRNIQRLKSETIESPPDF